MADVSGVQDELGSDRQRINLVDGSLEGTDDIRVGRLVESHVTVADLHKCKFAFVHLGRVAAMAKAIAVEHTAFEYADSASARPCHAAEKSAAVDAILMVVV